MLDRALREALSAHPAIGLFSNPLRGLQHLRTLDGGTLHSWVGERKNGSLELVRSGSGAAAVKLLLNEARLAGATRHKNLAELLWSARREDQLMLGFTWGPTFSLTYPVDLRWLLRAFITLAHAVGALHTAGWIHADLKPESVRWSEDPEGLSLWNLHIGQQPGPRAFEAYAARYAAPEQVAGGDLDARSDVYALGVMLYSLFIRDRFPSIIVPSTAGSPRAGGKRQAALSPITCVGELPAEPLAAAGANPFANNTDFGPSIQQMLNVVPQKKRPPPMQQQLVPPPAPLSAGGGGGGDDVQPILGAKVLFALELERVIQRNTDISVAKALLGVIERATAQKPAERYPDANAFAEALAKLLGLAEELAAKA